MTEKGMFNQDDLLRELKDRMEIEDDGFNPFTKADDDYTVLLWMRDTVQREYSTTYRTFISYISGAMHQYVVGDYVRGTILAIGIITPPGQETGNE